jgi:hypothetical protein
MGRDMGPSTRLTILLNSRFESTLWQFTEPDMSLGGEVFSPHVLIQFLNR